MPASRVADPRNPTFEKPNLDFHFTELKTVKHKPMNHPDFCKNSTDKKVTTDSQFGAQFMLNFTLNQDPDYSDSA
jgi:hypothetical protein